MAYRPVPPRYLGPGSWPPHTVPLCCAAWLARCCWTSPPLHGRKESARRSPVGTSCRNPRQPRCPSESALTKARQFTGADSGAWRQWASGSPTCRRLHPQRQHAWRSRICSKLAGGKQMNLATGQLSARQLPPGDPVHVKSKARLRQFGARDDATNKRRKSQGDRPEDLSRGKWPRSAAARRKGRVVWMAPCCHGNCDARRTLALPRSLLHHERHGLCARRVHVKGKWCCHGEGDHAFANSIGDPRQRSDFHVANYFRGRTCLPFMR